MKFAKRALSVMFVIALVVSLAVLVLLKTQLGLNITLSLLPDGIEVEKARGSLTSLSIDKLVYQQNGIAADAKGIKLEWHVLSLISGTFNLEKAIVNKLHLTITESDTSTEVASPSFQGLDLPIDVIVNRLSIANLSLAMSGETPITLQRIESRFSLDNNILRIDSIKLSNPDSLAKVSGKIDLSNAQEGQIELLSDVKWRIEDYSIISVGRAQGSWKSLSLTQQLSGPVAVNIEAKIDNILGDTISWNVRLDDAPEIKDDVKGIPITILEGGFESQGQFTAAEGLAGLELDVNGSASIAAANNALWKAAFDVTLANQNLTIQTLNLRQQDSKTPSISTQGQITQFVSFLNANDGYADLKGQWSEVNLDVGAHFQTQENKQALENRLVTSGSFSAQGIMSDLQLRLKSTGALLGVQHQIDLAARVKNRVLAITSFKAISDSSTLKLKGNADFSDTEPIYNLEWSINSTNIGDFVPLTSGDLVAEGRIEGAQSLPEVKVKAQSKSLSYQDLTISSVTANIVFAAIKEDSPLSLNLAFDELIQEGSTLVDSFDLLLGGSIGKHELEIKTSFNQNINLRLALTGTASNNTNDSTKNSTKQHEPSWHWSGDLARLSLSNTPAGDWLLDNSSQIEINTESLSLTPLCLRNFEQSMCLGADYIDGNQTANVQLIRFDLASIAPLFELADLNLSGWVDGQANYQLANDQTAPTIKLRLEAHDTQLSWEELDEETSTLQVENLGFDRFIVSLDQDSDLTLDADVLMSNGSSMRARSMVSQPFGAASFEQAKLSGIADVTITDLSDIPPSLTSAIDLNGALKSKVQFGGTVQRPTISVSSSLSGALAEIPQLGLAMRDINLNIDSQNDSVITVKGDMLLGEGTLNVDGLLDLSDFSSPVVQVDLFGTDLQLADSTEIAILSNVNLKTNVTKELLDISGNIDIQNARLDFELPDSAIVASSDVVIKGKDTNQTSMAQKLNITIDLGDNTRIQAQGLNAGLTGSLRAIKSSSGIIRGEGRINVVNGEYRAYGQRLDIDKGELIFNSGSIDDPSLQLRAQKTVDELTAGVQVSGQASDPVLTLYSSAGLSDQDILSVLIFNKPISELDTKDGLVLLQIANSIRSGGTNPGTLFTVTQNLQNALGLSELEVNLTGDEPNIRAGKQLSSRFYVGYGYGLLDAAQSLILRYKLSKAWSIKADLGNDSGADLRYQIDY